MLNRYIFTLGPLFKAANPSIIEIYTGSLQEAAEALTDAEKGRIIFIKED